jgi:hypothetical protein
MHPIDEARSRLLRAGYSLELHAGGPLEVGPAGKRRPAKPSGWLPRRNVGGAGDAARQTCRTRRDRWSATT